MAYAEPVEDQIPLHSIEAEMSALGSMFFGERAVDEVLAIVKAEDFYRPAHRLIFQAITALKRKGSAIDPVTVKAALVSKSRLDDAGGEEALIRIMEFVPSPANAKHYASIVRENAVLRNVEQTMPKMAACLRSPDIETTREKVAEIERLLRECDTSLRRELTSLHELRPRDHEQKGLSSGYPTIDKVTGFGLPLKQSVIVEAYTGDGKTTLMLGMALKQILSGMSVVYASFADLDDQDLGERMVTMLSGVKVKPRDGQRSLEDQQKWDQAVATLMDPFADAKDLPDLQFYYGPKDGMTVEEFCAQMRIAHRQRPRQVMYADYVQAMGVSRPSRDPLQDCLWVARCLQNLANELGNVVIFGSQISIGNNGQIVSKGSRSYEEFAGLIMRLKRDEQDPRLAELTFPRKRFNPLTRRKIGWDDDHLMFVER